jgi:hypothetical protein
VAAADSVLVEVNKQNAAERMGNTVRITFAEKDGFLDFRVAVAIPRGGKFLGAGLELTDNGKAVAQLPLKSGPNEEFNRGGQPESGELISFRMTPDIARRSYLSVGLDHAEYRIDLGSYLK